MTDTDEVRLERLTLELRIALYSEMLVEIEDRLAESEMQRRTLVHLLASEKSRLSQSMRPIDAPCDPELIFVLH